MTPGQELLMQQDNEFHKNLEYVLHMQCPACGSCLGIISERPFCNDCKLAIAKSDGIYRALLPERKEYFKRFIADYELVRQKEGRGSRSAAYYLSLPFEDVTRRNQWQWGIRARTFTFLTKKVLPGITVEHPEGACILDIGAGNCWLCHRLALAGHRPVALDVIDNPHDGLGAAAHYVPYSGFPRFQAEMDRLPFADAQFDAIIYNASFHYSTNYEITLKESLRCLRRPGYLIIMDSPFYRSSGAGDQMVKEKREAYRQKFGFASDSVPSVEYLTSQLLSQLSTRLLIDWNVEKPWYGISWALRPLKAFVLRKREPSKFYLFWARIK